MEGPCVSSDCSYVVGCGLRWVDLEVVVSTWYVVEKHVVSVCKYGSDLREVVVVVPDVTCIFLAWWVEDLRVTAICVA